MKKSATGFTIVELLIVVVVVAILASISLVAYQGIQQRARDSLRSNDIASIIKALDMHYVEHGSYPQSINPTGGVSGWELSSDMPDGWVFMQTLGEYTGSRIPIDPVNQGSLDYRYIPLHNGYTFTANSCSINQPFYVVRVTYESSSNNPTSAGTPAATCGGASGWVSTATIRFVAPPWARI